MPCQCPKYNEVVGTTQSILAISVFLPLLLHPPPIHHCGKNTDPCNCSSWNDSKPMEQDSVEQWQQQQEQQQSREPHRREREPEQDQLQRFAIAGAVAVSLCCCTNSNSYKCDWNGNCNSVQDREECHLLQSSLLEWM